MSGEVARRPVRTSAEVEKSVANYEPVRVAGVWDRRPLRVPTQVFAFLALSQSRMHVPLKSMPLYRFDAGITSDRSIYPLPDVDPDKYSAFVEEGLVQIVGGRLRKREVQVWVPRRVAPLALYPPIVEALGVFTAEAGIDWAPKTLVETDINQEFMTLRAPVPRQGITMELGGPSQQLSASAIVAAGLRLALGETLAVQDFRDYQAIHPELFTPLRPEEM